MRAKGLDKTSVVEKKDRSWCMFMFENIFKLSSKVIGKNKTRAGLQKFLSLHQMCVCVGVCGRGGGGRNLEGEYDLNSFLYIKNVQTS